MLFFKNIVLIFIVIRAIQMNPTIDLDASFVNSVLSVYIPDSEGIRNVSFNIEITSSGYTVYNNPVNITTPTSAYWMFRTEFRNASYVEHFSYISIDVTVRDNSNSYNYYFSYDWHTLVNAKCEAVVVSTITGNAYYCKKVIVFEDEFDILNMTKWKRHIRHGLYSAMEEFVIFNNLDDNLFIKDNQLHIRPTIVRGDLRRGEIDLADKCTAFDVSECELKIDAPYKVLPPVASAWLKSTKRFSLWNTRIEIRAKLPKGDWLIPHMWIRTCQCNYCSGIRIAFARGNVGVLRDNQDVDASGRLLSAGLVFWNKRKRHFSSEMHTISNQYGQHFGDDFHKYLIDIRGDRMYCAVDNQTYGEIDIFDVLLKYDNAAYGNIRRFKEPQFHIALGVSVGGHTDFANISSKPWQDSSPYAAMHFYRDGTWRDTWRGDEALIIDYIHIYKRRIPET